VNHPDSRMSRNAHRVTMLDDGVLITGSLRFALEVATRESQASVVGPLFCWLRLPALENNHATP